MYVYIYVYIYIYIRICIYIYTSYIYILYIYIYIYIYIYTYILSSSYTCYNYAFAYTSSACQHAVDTHFMPLITILTGAKARTDKLGLDQIRDVSWEPIREHAGYNILVLQAGSTDKSNLYFYYVPAQYCDDIRRAIMS